MTTPRVAPSLAPLTAAILTALRTGTGRPIGDLAAPPANAVPYGFLTRIDASWSGSMRNPHEMALVTYQLQCVGLDSAGVEWLEQRARQVLAAPPVAAGWRVLRYLPPDSPGGVRLDSDVSPPLAYSTPQWRLWAQPDPTGAP